MIHLDKNVYKPGVYRLSKRPDGEVAWMYRVKIRGKIEEPRSKMGETADTVVSPILNSLARLKEPGTRRRQALPIPYGQ